jgi:hypothetical protein
MRGGAEARRLPYPEDPRTNWPLNEIPCWAGITEIIIVDRYPCPGAGNGPRSLEAGLQQYRIRWRRARVPGWAPQGGGGTACGSGRA